MIIYPEPYSIYLSGTIDLQSPRTLWGPRGQGLGFRGKGFEPITRVRGSQGRDKTARVESAGIMRMASPYMRCEPETL